MNNSHSTPPGQLERSFTLEPIGEGHYQVITDPNYESGNGMYGGWTAALLLKAAIEDGRGSGFVSAITVNYVSKVPSGKTLEIRVSLLGGGKTVTHLQVDLINPETLQRHAMATALFSSRTQSSSFLETDMPANAAATDAKVFIPPGAFGEQMDIMPVSGYPPVNQPNTRSMSWVRERSHRELDAVQLAFLADMYAPRVWFTKSAPCRMATITLTAYFFATASELTSVADDYILIEAIGTRGNNSTYGAKANLWSRAGALLATTEQLAWFAD